MPRTPSEMIQALLKEPTNPAVVHQLVDAEATYVSLNYSNPELKRIMPWAGTSKGPDAVLSTYERVSQYWENQAFQIEDIVASQDKVAVFGRFTYKSKTLGKAITSPFSILAKVRDEKIVYMQFMEDTFGTAATFRMGDAETFHSDPAGGPVTM